MDLILKRRGSQPADGYKLLTAIKFLGKDGGPAYVTPQQLLEFVDTARIEDIEEFQALFGLVKEQLQIVVPRKQRMDRGARPYKYPNFIRPNSPDGVKVVLIGNINQFMMDYRDGKFITNFTLEDLVTEAEKV